MKDTQLYSQILGIKKPWKVMNVQISLADDEVQVTVVRDGGKLKCPKCGKTGPGYDRPIHDFFDEKSFCSSYQYMQSGLPQ